MLKAIRLLVIASFLLGPATLRGQDPHPLNLDDLVAEALQNNPQLRSARNETAAARTKGRQVTSWDAPQIGVEFYQTPIQSFPQSDKERNGDRLLRSTDDPFPGKALGYGEVADNNAGMIGQDYKALERRIIRDLKSAYFELFHVQRKIQVNAENQELMKKFTEITRKQYEVGMGQQADILRAQTELSSLINEGVNLSKEKKVVESMINTIVSRQANAPLGSVPDAEISGLSGHSNSCAPLRSKAALN